MLKYKQIFSQIFQIRPQPTNPSDEETNPAPEVLQFIGKDLHENIGPSLLVVRLHIEELKRKMRKEDLSTQLDALSRTTNDLIQNMREIMWTLHPQNHTLENTVYFICECFLSTMETTTLTPNVIYPDLIPDINLPVASIRCLFLCTREAADFISQHTTGNQVNLRVDVSDSDIWVKMHVNGAVTRQSKEDLSDTLKSIERRMAAVNGTCSLFTSSLGVTVWFKASTGKY
jgi:signal transduction histidine kinase